MPPHRHAFLLGGVLAATGAAFGWSAQEDARVGSQDPHARSAGLAWSGARQSAVAANVSFALAAVAVSVGLVFELLPEDAARTAQEGVRF